MEGTTPSQATGFRAVADSERRTGNLRRSCEVCRSLKVRCIPKTDRVNASQTCERCSKNGAVCIFEHAIARPRRAKRMPKSITKAVEEKIEGLVTLISSISEKQDTRIECLPNVDPATILTHNSKIEHTTSWPSDYQDVISKGFLTADEASQLLANFVVASAEFPLVLLPFQDDLECLRQERPCVLLAILTACARDHLQVQLEVEFRTILAEKVILNAEKTIDLLQGLLVFLTWNHLYFNSAKEQIYQLSQIAVTIAVELRLGPPDETARELLIQHGEMIDNSTYGKQNSTIVEMMRTFIACYYISSSISLSMRRPTHFKFCRNISECCRLLRCLSHTEVLPCFVQLQGLAEEVDLCFHYNNKGIAESVDYIQIQAMIYVFKGKLERLMEQFPPFVKANSLIQRKCLYLQVYIQEISLYSPTKHRTLNDLCNLNCCNWCSSLPRLGIVITCVRAAQNYINEYVFLPKRTLRHTVLFQESELLYAILVLAVVTLEHINVEEPGQLRELADISSYLTTLRDKMMSMETLTQTGQDSRDYFWKMTQFFKHCLNWISQYVTCQSDSMESCFTSAENNMSFIRILENIPTEEVVQDNMGFNTLDMSWIINHLEV